jgi:hypothetical protein
MLPKIHKNITLVEINDPVILRQLTGSTQFPDYMLKQVSPTHFIIDNQYVETLLKELQEGKLTPRIIDCSVVL